MNSLCPQCSSLMIDGETSVTLWRDGISVEIQHVPARVCTHCDETTIHIDVAEELDRLADAVVAQHQELDRIAIKAIETAQPPTPLKTRKPFLRGVSVAWPSAQPAS